jgi:hypothetical protein
MILEYKQNMKKILKTYVLQNYYLFYVKKSQLNNLLIILLTNK